MEKSTVVVLISAGTEWDTVRKLYPDAEVKLSPYGEWFKYTVAAGKGHMEVCFMYGGWGKVAAAASTQYAVHTWSPQLMVNMGTCGGFDGHITTNTVILVNKTLVYDIIEQMGDQAATIAHYSTALDYTWLKEPYPYPVRVGLLISGDRDLVPDQVAGLHKEFGAVAGDWESASIAWVAKRNNVRCMILRMVTDLVGSGGGEVYDGKLNLFKERARYAMSYLLNSLSDWLECAGY